MIAYLSDDSEDELTCPVCGEIGEDCTCDDDFDDEDEDYDDDFDDEEEDFDDEEDGLTDGDEDEEGEV